MSGRLCGAAGSERESGPIRAILARMRLSALIAVLISVPLVASDAYPPPRFTDPDRVRKLESAMPEVDRIFRDYASDRKIPGMVWGVVIDGRLAHVESVGVRDRASQAPVDAGHGVPHRVDDQELHGARRF